MSCGSGLPLDKKEIIDGSSNKSLPALDPHWASRSRFVAYVAPPVDSSDQGLMGEWLERLQYIATDLHWLLQLNHHKFWCQAIFDVSLHNMLDSFLRYSPRPYDVSCELSGHSRSLHAEVSRLVFFTYLRMATYKESKDNWLTPEVFGEIIYENFLFDIPKLMDLCALYGRSNGALLTKMVANIFTCQPCYTNDLKSAGPTVIQVLVNMAVTCGLETDRAGLTPHKLDSGRGPVSLVAMETGELTDRVLCLADCAITLTAFLQVYPPACLTLHGMDFCQSLARMYDKLVPAFQDAVKQRVFENVREKKRVRTKLCQAKTHLLTAFHLIVSHTCLQPVLQVISSRDADKGGQRSEVSATPEGVNPEVVTQALEDFLAVMAAVLGEKRFLADYEAGFSFQDDMDILSQAAGDVDEAHYRYILEAINAAFAAHGKRRKPTGNTNRGGRTSPDGSPCPPSAPKAKLPAQALQAGGPTPPASQGAEAAQVSGVELESLVCAVQDLLPHLGGGFVRLALAELGYDVEAVLSAVLEDRLPPALRDLDLALEHSTTPPVSVAEDFAPPTLLVDARHNIYDNDQFDVFSNRDLALQNIHKGKREVDASLLEDKDTVRALKSTYDAYGSVDVASGSIYDPHLYDDDYDDTYDQNNVGAKDADEADELTRRPFTVPQILRKPAPRERLADSSSEEEAGSRDQFVQDPAKLRERQEQNRRGGGNWSAGGGKVHDVKGKAKGQGQTEDVTRNRQFKDKNKSSRANHNRRAQAAKKQSKGMF